MPETTKKAKVAKKAKKTKKISAPLTYEQACHRAAELLAGGMGLYRSSRTLEEEGYPTKKGGAKWRRSTVRNAAKRGGWDGGPDTPPSGGGRGRKPQSAASHPSTPAQPQTAREVTRERAALGMLPLAREPRRGALRMLSKGEWERLPSTVRSAVIDRLSERLLAGGAGE